MNTGLCSTPFGDFSLERVPVDRSGTLRAWDGADLLLLDAAASFGVTPSTRVLVIGDNFGALSVALAGASTWVLSDSIVAEHAIEENLSANRAKVRVGGVVQFISAAQPGPELAATIGGAVDLVVWNVGKSTDVTAHVASLLPSVSHGATVVFAAGMDKHLPPKTGDILRRHGQVTTHPGRKKAHLFELRAPAEATGLQPADPVVPDRVSIPEYDLHVSALPGVFSADRFDLGTRVLADLVADLDRLLPAAEQVVDLGCGTGVLGMLALRSLPQASVSFVDESTYAVASAEANVIANAGTLGPAALDRSSFIRSNVFDDTRLAEVDLVLCNPPFHHANAMNDQVAWQMFQQSRRVLRRGGELWVVANRHLGYHEKLARLYEATALMASHPKFVVIAARA